MTAELLCQVLHLPKGTKITDAKMSFQTNNAVEFKVTHEDLPEVIDGVAFIDVGVEFERVEISSRWKF